MYAYMQITADIMGGLGHQLFIAFTVMSYAIQHDIDYFLPTTIKEGTRKKTYFDSILDQIPSRDQVDSSWHVYRESRYTYSPLPAFLTPNHLHGYFQSYKYFMEHSPEIAELLKLEEKRMEITHKYPLAYSELASMHFRLGDYKAATNYHPILEESYYVHAIKLLLGKHHQLQGILYFREEEDVDTVASSINRLQTMFPSLSFIQASDQAEDWELLLMMTLCSHHIIANSAFSWWGAFLGEVLAKKDGGNGARVVVYPEVWFGPSFTYLSTRDLFPPHWQRVSS